MTILFLGKERLFFRGTSQLVSESIFDAALRSGAKQIHEFKRKSSKEDIYIRKNKLP